MAISQTNMQNRRLVGVPNKQSQVAYPWPGSSAGAVYTYNSTALPVIITGAPGYPGLIVGLTFSATTAGNLSFTLGEFSSAQQWTDLIQWTGQVTTGGNSLIFPVPAPCKGDRNLGLTGVSWAAGGTGSLNKLYLIYSTTLEGS